MPGDTSHVGLSPKRGADSDGFVSGMSLQEILDSSFGLPDGTCQEFNAMWGVVASPKTYWFAFGVPLKQPWPKGVGYPQQITPCFTADSPEIAPAVWMVSNDNAAGVFADPEWNI